MCVLEMIQFDLFKNRMESMRPEFIYVLTHFFSFEIGLSAYLLMFFFFIISHFPSCSFSLQIHDELNARLIN